MDRYEMLRQVSRTFALSIEQLPSVLRDSITVAYLLLRVSDCLEDDAGLAADCKADLLRVWAGILGGDEPVERLTSRLTMLDGTDPEVYVAQHAADVMAGLDALPGELQAVIVQRVTETSLGMARWQEHGPWVADEAEMDDYMHEVAGRVGYLLTDLFAWHSPKILSVRDTLMPLSREYGLALQTVNVIRGMRKDYERGWVFVPRSVYEHFGLTRDSLFDPANMEQAMAVVDVLAEKAERHLRLGLDYVSAFPVREYRVRLACMWPLFFAVRTLAVSRNNANVLLNEAKMGRDQVRRIMHDTTLLGWSNGWLEHYYQQLARPIV
jgi:farnesyl-diphosphate farnesyltransferase